MPPKINGPSKNLDQQNGLINYKFSDITILKQKPCKNMPRPISTNPGLNLNKPFELNLDPVVQRPISTNPGLTPNKPIELDLVTLSLISTNPGLTLNKPIELNLDPDPVQY